MARQVKSWFGTIAATLLAVCAPEVSHAQQLKPTIEQILQVWKNRQEKVATARFELDLEETIHKGRTSLIDAGRRRAAGLPPEPEPNPPRDYLVKGTGRVSLDGAKLRYSYQHEQWDPIGKKLYPERYVDTFDGKLCKFLQVPISGQKDYPLAKVTKSNVSQSALKFPIIPLIFTFRGNHPQFFHKLETFRVSGHTVTIGGRPCCELVSGKTSSNRQEILYLDKERDYVVVREMIMVNNQPNWQAEVDYASDEKIGWVPQAWEYIIRWGKEHKILNSGRSKVIHYEINRA